MRFRFTIFLILANAALFFAIWSLEMKGEAPLERAADNVSFTRLRISGKNLDKPRVLSFENNKWRIVSPIDWPANLYAVNRIRNQLDFLSKETSFDLSEMKKYGHTLAEYGLEDPLFVLEYGGAKKTNRIRVGNTAPIGGRVYLYDEGAGKIIVVDKEFVGSLVMDFERLRNQLVFDIPRFEVSAFSVRTPVGDGKSGQGNFRRLGLAKDEGKWKIETPISAVADTQEVEAFLNDICHLTADSFEDSERADMGFNLMPAAIAIQGTNRRQVLILGGPTKDGKRIYARLEDNPTVFTVDAEKFKNLAGLQNALRDKAFFRFDAADVSNIDISKGGKILKLRKLTGGVWDVIGAGENGATLTAKADLSRVNDLLSKLSNVRARDFVSDIPSDNLSAYGIGRDCLKIRITQSDQTSRTLEIGSNYDYRSATLSYARADASGAVYGISRALEDAASTDFLFYRSKILSSLPEKAKIVSIKIFRVRNDEEVFSIASEGGDFKKALAALSPRESAAAASLFESVRLFEVGGYLPGEFSAGGFKSGGENIRWAYKIEAVIMLPGAGSAFDTERRSWYVSRAFGGNLQYGGSERLNAVFTLTADMIDALRELTLERSAPRQLDKPAPVSAERKPVGSEPGANVGVKDLPVPSPASVPARGAAPEPDKGAPAK